MTEIARINEGGGAVVTGLPVHRCTDRCGGGFHYDSSEVSEKSKVRRRLDLLKEVRARLLSFDTLEHRATGDAFEARLRRLLTYGWRDCIHCHPDSCALAPEEAREMPGAFTAYRRADGEPLWGDPDAPFETPLEAATHWCFHEAGTPPDAYEEVVMVPVVVRRFPCHEEPTDD